MFNGSILPVEKIKQISSRYPKNPTQIYSYGTAGFRYSNEIMDPVLFRTGLLAALRSKFLDSKTVGVMITASHNKEADNGVKLVDPLGEMLVSSWENYATDLANASLDQFPLVLSKLCTSLNVDLSKKAKVVIGRDTRPSGVRLVRCLIDGLKCLDAEFIDLGEVSTPQLHFVVRAINTNGDVATEEGYNSKLANAFKNIVSNIDSSDFELLVDCANGVGAPKLQKIAALIGKDLLKVTLVNTDIRGKGVLNFNCGADYVKIEQKLPAGIDAEKSAAIGCASLDGDADRVVFYFTDPSTSKFMLLDGDKIAALAADYISELISKIPNKSKEISIGVVQTAYANGSSTRFFESKNIKTVCTETGVKHLHHAAESFDVGVYFEANGHGTVLFKEALLGYLRDNQSKEAKIVCSLAELINQSVGDAISDLLMVIAILMLRKWTFKDWSEKLYKELANRQLKVKVKDRSSFVTTNADRQLLKPEGIQTEVDALTSKFENGRCFVRPSGTEDVVRVYAESITQDFADDLAYSVASLIYDKAGGVGEKPIRK